MAVVDIFTTDKKYNVIYADPPWQFSSKEVQRYNGNRFRPLETVYKQTIKLIWEGEKHLDTLAEGFTEAIHIAKYIAPPWMQCRWCGAGIASTAARIWEVCTVVHLGRACIALCLQISGARMADGGRILMHKTNPRRIPRTQADVDKAYSNGVVEGLNRGIDLMLYVLIDKHDAPMDDVQQLASELNHAAQCVAEGYVTWADIRQMLKEDGVETALE